MLDKSSTWPFWGPHDVESSVVEGDLGCWKTRSFPEEGPLGLGPEGIEGTRRVLHKVARDGEWWARPKPWAVHTGWGW